MLFYQEIIRLATGEGLREEGIVAILKPKTLTKNNMGTPEVQEQDVKGYVVVAGKNLHNPDFEGVLREYPDGTLNVRLKIAEPIKPVWEALSEEDMESLIGIADRFHDLFKERPMTDEEKAAERQKLIDKVGTEKGDFELTGGDVWLNPKTGEVNRVNPGAIEKDGRHVGINFFYVENGKVIGGTALEHISMAEAQLLLERIKAELPRILASHEA